MRVWIDNIGARFLKFPSAKITGKVVRWREQRLKIERQKDRQRVIPGAVRFFWIFNTFFQEFGDFRNSHLWRNIPHNLSMIKKILENGASSLKMSGKCGETHRRGRLIRQAGLTNRMLNENLCLFVPLMCHYLPAYTCIQSHAWASNAFFEQPHPHASLWNLLSSLIISHTWAHLLIAVLSFFDRPCKSFMARCSAVYPLLHASRWVSMCLARCPWWYLAAHHVQGAWLPHAVLTFANI